MRYEILEGMPSQMPFGIQLDEPGGGLPLAAPDQCPPFHYATHYMSAAVVLHYLIRLQVRWFRCLSVHRVCVLDLQ